MPPILHDLQPLPRSRILSRFGEAANGATAVEFGLVALPVLLLIAGIVQCAFTLWAAQNLDAMLDHAVRSLTTGTFQAANASTTDSATLLTKLKTVMCSSDSTALPTVFTCSDVKLNVSVSSSFASGNFATAYDSSTKSISSSFESYTCPAAGAITVVTAVVAFPNIFTALLPSFSTLGDGSFLLTSTAVFRTEPYTTTSC